MPDAAGKTDRNGIQVIARAAAILRVMKDSPSGLSLGQIADRVGLPRSTVQRITSALAAERLVASAPDGSGLQLGPELAALAEAVRHDVVERCRPVLASIAQATGETADLAVLRGGGMVFLDQVSGRHRLRTVSSVGETFPLTTTANGKACLALMSEARARILIENEWKRHGVAGDADALLAILQPVRDRGLAHDLDEHTSGISAIGFAFRDQTGELHAISVPIPSTRYETSRRAVEDALAAARTEIEELMSV